MQRQPSGFPFWNPSEQSALDTASSEPMVSASDSEAAFHVAPVDADQFSRNRELLAGAIRDSASLVSQFSKFNQEHCSKYPSQLSVNVNTSKRGMQRTMTSRPASGDMQRPSVARSMSLASPDATTAASEIETVAEKTAEHPLSVLAVDLNEGHTASSLPALLKTLKGEAIANLLGRRLESALSHLSALQIRVGDNASRILVTGDLNAGKSTFVNALLRKDMMPVDQQPCTTVFCEVLDAVEHNDGKEEVHAIKEADLATYSPTDKSTFTRFDIGDAESVCCDEQVSWGLIKVYTTEAGLSEKESFVRNGQVSISLIDAPGLNRDTLSTTALFARQSEIDVVVFVVSAENHFTLSAKEFLWNAAREKAYVFVVVNKFAGIKDKKRCERMVGEQIKQLSPATWENREELVHFVDAISARDPSEPGQVTSESFKQLEEALRSFVLMKRSTSKLAPAKTYLLNLLTDLELLTEANKTAAEQERDAALERLDDIRPFHENLLKRKAAVEDAIVRVEDSREGSVKNAVWSRLEKALACIGKGELVSPGKDEVVPSFPNVEPIQAPTSLPSYPGVWGVWQWAADVKQTLLQSLEAEVCKAEEFARQTTTDGVDEITKTLSIKLLKDENNTQPQRVFRPEQMFLKRRQRVASLRKMNTASAVGLGIADHNNQISILDLFDLERLLPFTKDVKLSDEEVEAAGAFSVVSIGVGALTMFGSRAVGVKGFVEAIARTCDVLGSAQARKWAGPIIGVLTAGLAVYVVLDLPRAVPRNIGRKLQASLVSPDPAISFSHAQADRVSKETRKVLRLAGWDVRERFRAAVEKAATERKEVESLLDKSQDALVFLTQYEQDVQAKIAKVEQVSLE